MPETVVNVKNLTVDFGGFKAVNNISFSVTKGEIFGFLGANGAGKTTTIRVLNGLLVPTSGQVEVVGIALSEKTAMSVKKRVGYMSQKFTLYNDLTVEENLQFTADLRGMPRALAKSRQRELLEFVGFTRTPSLLVGDLPGGMKQQVALANASMHDPDLIFLDEPTAGVSPSARSLFWKLIRSLAERGKTIFVTSHYMDEVEQCNRIALMRSGEIIALDSPGDLKDKTFPKKMFEIEISEKINRGEIENWKNNGAFGLFNAYGIHYHVTTKDEKAWIKFKSEHEGDVKIREIKPSLEDVFIRLVEGQSR